MGYEISRKRRSYCGKVPRSKRYSWQLTTAYGPVDVLCASTVAPTDTSQVMDESVSPESSCAFIFQATP